MMTPPAISQQETTKNWSNDEIRCGGGIDTASQRGTQYHRDGADNQHKPAGFVDRFAQPQNRKNCPEEQDDDHGHQQ